MPLIDCLVTHNFISESDAKRISEIKDAVTKLTASGTHEAEAEAIVKNKIVNEEYGKLHTELESLKKEIYADKYKATTAKKIALPGFKEINKKYQEEKQKRDVPLVDVENKKKQTISETNKQAMYDAKKVYEDAAGLDNSTDARGLALEYFAGGGKLHPSAIADEVVGKNKSGINRGKKTGEVKARDYVDNSGKTIDQIAHSIWDNLPENIQNIISDRDIKNELISVVSDHNKRLDFAKELLKRSYDNLAQKEFTKENAEAITEGLKQEILKHVDELPDEQREDLVKIVSKYQNQYGLIDWQKMQEDFDGFNPDILSLPEATFKALDEIIQKNNSRQGQRGNDAGDSSRLQDQERPPGKTNEQKATEELITAKTEQVRIAREALAEKRKQLDKGLIEDQSNLFGERKSAATPKLFDERASQDARSKALKPFEDRVQKELTELGRLNKVLEGYQGKPSSQTEIQLKNEPQQKAGAENKQTKPPEEAAPVKEGLTKTPPPEVTGKEGEVKDFNKKVDDLLAKLKDKLIPKHLRDVGKQGGGLEEIIDKAASFIKEANRIGGDIKEAIEKAVKHIKDNWDEAWGTFDESSVREVLGEVVPPPEPPKEQVGGEGSDPEMTKMANAIMDAHVEGKFGVAALDKILGKLQDTDLKAIYEKVKGRIQKGLIDIKKVRERLLTTKQGSEEDQAVLMYDLAELKGKESEITKAIIEEESGSQNQLDLQRQLMDVQNEMMDNALANRVLGRTGSTIFRLRQLWINREKSIVDYQEEYKSSRGLKDLTPEQEKEIQSVYNKNRELRVKAENAKADLDKAIDENAKLKEENDKLKKLKEKAANQKKADRRLKTEESVKKSNDRIKQAKDNLRGLRGNLSAGFDPRVAIEVGKIAAEKFYQGIVKFDELVKNVLDDVKDVFPSWTEEDVVNHILTTADKQGNLVPTLTSDRYLASKKLLGKSNEVLREKAKVYERAQTEVALQQFEWQKERRMDMMKSRPMGERIIDGVLRWQRFAVLSYPSTMVKLLAVVGHQLTLKPLKFAIQKFVATPISKGLGIAGKQNIWGDPKWSSLGKYYSTFIRNFALTNLKEQFKGIDTKEVLYGRPMVFDEWNAARGLLEMPGRSHGYIKSFIKNPEFQFAHEQNMSYHIGKMEELQKKLENTSLTTEQTAELQKEYDTHDVTNEDVMERINKLSLEHSKWSILMNDNKFVERFRQWTSGNDIASALIKSELPIVKIPINYVGRAFATKYGLIKALTGSKWYKGDTPSILSIIYRGAEGVTENQADLLGKALTLGSMGAAFFMLGYWNRKNAKVNEDGSIEIGGQHFSKNLIHSPELESFFSGAETGNRFEKQKKKDKEQWLVNFAQSDLDIAKKNPFASMLTYGFLPNVATTLLSKRNQDKVTTKVSDAVARKVGDMLVPGFVKQTAGWLDTGEKGIHPMKDVIKRNPSKSTEGLERFWQIIEKDIPGLRQNVPASQQVVSFTEEHLKSPAIKLINTKGWHIPQTNYATIKVKNETTLSENNLIDYDEETINKFDALKERYLVAKVEAAKNRGVWVDKYKKAHLKIWNEQGELTRIPEGAKSTAMDKLTEEQGNDIMSKAGTNASEKAKKEIEKFIIVHKKKVSK